MTYLRTLTSAKGDLSFWKIRSGKPLRNCNLCVSSLSAKHSKNLSAITFKSCTNKSPFRNVCALHLALGSTCSICARTVASSGDKEAESGSRDLREV
jgi:hypothetical protein